MTDRRSRTSLAEARDRHRARSRTRQTLTIAGGWFAGAAGVLLVVPAPELGLPLLLLGLRLLAVEHDWAARLYAPVSRFWVRMRSLPRTAKLALSLGALALVGTLACGLADQVRAQPFTICEKRITVTMSVSDTSRL